MSAGDHLGQQFFHGSDHEFQVGDTVNTKDHFAWASTQPEVASHYGKKVYKVEPLNGDIERQPGAHKSFGIHTSRTGFRVTGVHDGS